LNQNMPARNIISLLSIVMIALLGESAASYSGGRSAPTTKYIPRKTTKTTSKTEQLRAYRGYKLIDGSPYDDFHYRYYYDGLATFRQKKSVSDTFMRP